jgi:hypothetical protein
MAIEIVDLAINSMVIFHSYVSLPEGNVGKTTMNHPPVITIFMGGISTIKRGVVYYCFTHISYIFQITIDYIEL